MTTRRGGWTAPAGVLLGAALAAAPLLASQAQMAATAVEPSRTAQRAALHRAAHQVLDRPLVFDDPLALGIVGRQAAAFPSGARYDGAPAMRALIALRSRFAEDALAEAVARGVGQYVVLGAGLDTFAYRNPHPALRVFEVDHPATQAWKRARLAEAGIAVPASLTFVPIDFETQRLGDALQAAGFDAARPAFFSLLGVTVYLTPDAVRSTLALVAAGPQGNEIVFDYAIPSAELGPAERSRRDAAAARVAAFGEPWINRYAPQELAAELGGLGFRQIDDLDAARATERYFSGRSDGLAPARTAHLMRARR